jgi:hypothetical protein
MSKKNDIYDVSAELAREFGEIGTQSRAEATSKAWEEYMRRYSLMFARTLV